MKYFLVVTIAALLATPTIATAITIDGVADTSYGSAISTQQIGTAAVNNTSTNIGVANGSELDAAYGFVSNATLYLVVAGNFASSPSGPRNDQLHTFFMSDAGGTDHTLGGFYNGTFSGRINNMAGLTFDTGFTPNYWIGANVGLCDGCGDLQTVSMFVDYMVVCSNCASAFLGSVIPTNSPPAVLTNIYFGSSVQLSVNNSNTGGVNAVTCGGQSNAAASVRSGIEMSIELGAIGNPTGTIRVCTFITEQTMNSIYNQVLGPLSGGTGYCTNCLASDPPLCTAGLVDFSTLPGQHYFTIKVPPCDVILVNPTTAAYTSTGGVGSVTAAVAGGCPLSVSTTDSWLAVTGTFGLISGNGSFTYSVAPNTNSIFARTGRFFITDTAVTGLRTQLVTITQTGVPAPPLSSIFPVDGIAESAYGCPLVVQQIGTQFGDNTSTNLQPVSSGSELDAAYGMVQNNVLFLLLAGNLENNFNEIEIFFMTGPGGASTLSTNNFSGAGGNALNSLASQGFTFDTGFAPNYWIGANGGGSPYTLFFDYAQLWPGGTNAAGVATNGNFLGSTTTTNGTLLGTNPFGIQATINNSNTGGVDGVGCSTNGLLIAQSIAATTVKTGIELGIPLGAIGSPTGSIYICAFVSGGGNHTFLSNQFLPPIGSNNICQGNLGNTNVNLATLPGVPHFFAVGPEMRVTSIIRSNNDIRVSYLPENNTNLVYRLERASVLSNNTAWTAVTGFTAGTNTTITATDAGGANNTGRFYRVTQRPLCP